MTDPSRIRGGSNLHLTQRVGAVAATPADGVRAGGQDAQDTDSGVQRRGHVAFLQGDGRLLHTRLPLGGAASHHRQDEQTCL